MKWLRIILPIFLIMGMLLCFSSVAYADDPAGDPPPEPPPDPPPGLNVNVTVVGNNSEVGVDLYGDDNTANVEFHSENPTVYINGQNLNEPIAVYNIQNYGGGGVDGDWVKQKISQALAPIQSWAEETAARLGLTMDGLAKVILLAQDNEAELDTQISLLDTHEDRLTTLESETASLGERVDALEAQDAAIQAEINYLRDYYNSMLLIIIGAFSVVVIGLGAGLFLVWRRNYKG
jgi:uncharacterized protein YciI